MVRPAIRLALWTALYFLAGQLGLATVLEGQLLNLVSPAAGVSVVWFATGSRGTWQWDTAALVVASVILNIQLGAPLAQVVLGTAGSVLLVVVFVVLMRRWAGDLTFFGGERDLWRVHDLGVFLVAAILAAIAMAAGSTLGQVLAGLPGIDMETFLIRWGRTSSAIVAVGSAGLLLANALRQVRTWRSGPTAVVREVLSRSQQRRVEGVGLLVFSAVIYWLAFAQLDRFPLTFLLFVASVWVGTRFAPATIAVHGLLVGTAAVWFTIEGHGVFVGVDDIGVRAVFAQLFVLVMSTTGLVIGLGRAELGEAERLSEERAQLFDDVLHEVRDGIAVIQQGGHVLVLNPAGKELLGVDPSDSAGEPGGAGRLLDAEGNQVTDDDLPHYRALRGEEIRGEVLHVRSSRVDRILEVSAHVLPTTFGEERRALVSYHEITADRRHRDALTAFAGHVAHDLKNPLTVIEGWTESLTDAFEAGGSVDSAVGLGMLRRIDGASIRMREFIRELLAYTLARDQSLRPKKVDLVAMAEEVASTQLLAAVGVTPGIHVRGAGEAWADPLLLRIVFDNLVGNACKYVAPGVVPEVEVVVTTIDDVVEVAITDNGIGIPDDQRQLVFESFHRVPQDGYQGTGLGLAICHRIIDRHGGEIWVAPSPDPPGSCFRFTLPARPLAP